MKSAIVNGSPRGNTSNSLRMARWIKDMYTESIIPQFNLTPVKRQQEVLETLKDIDTILFIFPLYVDSMPGIVKEFFERLEAQKKSFKGKSFYFLIHSGFPEMNHSRSLQRYLEYFSSKVMQVVYMGTLIMAGSESMQMAPDQLYGRQKPIIQSMAKLIENGQAIPESLNQKMNRRERLSIGMRIAFMLNPFKNFYWNHRANQHDHKADLKAQPYING